ncbi:MAG: amidohydrolase, partial [Flavobacteriaceae bacterium]|nr:amidohydrolase [Flavobacteriaceae bacterium]
MNFKPTLLTLSAIFLILGCNQREPADVILYNAKVYLLNSNFDTAEAIAIKEGKILAFASSEELLKKYSAGEQIDVQGKAIYPGLYDAHCHFSQFALQLQYADLRGAKSLEEIVERLQTHQQHYSPSYLMGMGWDQNLWADKSMPSNALLNQHFPDIPVALHRIDMHAILANDTALTLAKIDANTPITGGEIVIENGKPTGLLIDNPMFLVEKTFPEPDEATKKVLFQEAEQQCLALGLTTLTEAGLHRHEIEYLEQLIDESALSLQFYAMISDHEENLSYYLPQGIIKKPQLHIRSVKYFGDGALGSRGAALKKPYSDLPHHHGKLLFDPNQLHQEATRIKLAGYQLNAHAIGDSTNYVLLKTFDEVLKDVPDPRWRIEHAQILDAPDFKFFSKKILASVQPLHATSDMYWAVDRVGETRIKTSYAYQSLLKQSGMLAFGTDFPVEVINPFHTFYAAITRQDLNQYPEGGFLPTEKVSRENALRAMTIWAAYASFEEH